MLRCQAGSGRGSRSRRRRRANQAGPRRPSRPGHPRHRHANFLQTSASNEDTQSRALTIREEEILTLVAEGPTSQAIAGMFVISIKTVERHRADLLQKLALRDRLELTRNAIRSA